MSKARILSKNDSQASTIAGAALGTAAIGTSTSYARADHVHAAPTTITGNAGTATTLQTARTINGVSFDGTANITVADATKAPLTGTGASGTWGISISGNAGTATNVAYTGLTGTVPTWNQNTSGNAATATKLATARTINGVAFDGTANITVADATKLPTTGGNVSGNLRVTSGVLGYGPGAGGTATQETSKSAPVTLNKPCGQITMHPAEMGTGSLGFTLNNSLLSDADGLIVTPTGPFTNYAVEVAYYPTATSVVLRVRNFDVPRSDALIINFMLIKGSKT